MLELFEIAERMKFQTASRMAKGLTGIKGIGGAACPPPHNASAKGNGVTGASSTKVVKLAAIPGGARATLTRQTSFC